MPEAFKVFVHELQSLGLSLEVLNDAEQVLPMLNEADADRPDGLDLNLAGYEPEGLSELSTRNLAQGS